jgi:hypothetical protein
MFLQGTEHLKFFKLSKNEKTKKHYNTFYLFCYIKPFTHTQLYISIRKWNLLWKVLLMRICALIFV